METGYFFLGDVLGFKNIVKNTSETDETNYIEKWVSLVKSAAEFCGLAQEPQLISDTVFATAPAMPEGLQQLIRFSRYLLEHGFEQSLLLRGAITFGPHHWGKLTYGLPVIEAHELEASQDWIGVTCADIPDADHFWGPKGLVCYPAPFKEGLIRLHPVVVWDVPTQDRLILVSTSVPLSNAGEVLRWNWRRRLRNTLDFSEYLKSRSNTREDWAIYNGNLV